MALTIIDAATAAAVSAATTQQAQLTALLAAFGQGSVTVRMLAGTTLLSSATHAPWTINTATPRAAVIGAWVSRSFAAPGAPTRIVFRAGSTDVFELTAGVGSGDVSFASNMTSLRRERVDGLSISAAASLPVGAAPPAPPPAPPPTEPSPSPAPGSGPTGAYRSSQPLLFADVSAATDVQVTTESAGTLPRTPPRPSVADPKMGFIWGVYGPSHFYVSHREQWRWTTPGGDWVNRDGTPQATTNPHFSFAANAVASGSAQYTVDMAAALNAAFNAGRWAAFIVRVSASSRSVAGLHHATLAPPSIAVTYTDGSTETLECTCCTGLTPSSAYAQTGLPDAVLPLALEFRRPIKQVATAPMTINVTGHTATAATISGYLANPNTAAGSYTLGVAATYAADAGLLAAPGMQMVQRFEDGSVLSDFVLPFNGTDYFAAADWDGSMTGGAVDLTKLPTAARGAPLANKWLQKQPSPNVSLVNSSYTGDGFQPHTPGLGALRIVIPGTTLADGGAMGPDGSLGCDLVSLFSKSVAGTEAARVVNTRYRLRLGTPPRTLANTKMIRETGGTAVYATVRGKGGIGPMHWTHGGGNNQVGGGGLGWTGRLGIEQIPADMENGGMVLFTHSLDMDPAEEDMAWGGTNGLAPTIYPNEWVEIEIRTALNTFNPAGGSPSDGVQEIYINGRLATTLTNWQWRDGPIAAAAPGRQPAMGTLGALGAIMNFYQGGRLAADGDLVFFVSAIAVSVGGVYIGPMTAAAAPPLQITGNAWTPNRDGSGNVLQTDFEQMPVLGGYLEVQDSLAIMTNVMEKPPYVNFASTPGERHFVDVWNGMSWSLPLRKGWMYAAGGHAANRQNDNPCIEFDANTMRFLRIRDRASEANLRGYNATTHQIQAGLVDGLAFNSPQGDGSIGTVHTFDGQVYIPPGGPGAGPTKGGLHVTGWARQTINLDTGALTTPWWNRLNTAPFTNWAYTASVRVGSVIYHPRDSFSIARFDLSATQATDHSATSAGSLNYSYANHTTQLVHNHRAFCDMASRRECVSISGVSGAQAVRMRYGAAHDAGATNWQPYMQVITLTSSDGSHTDFTPANFTDPGGEQPSKFFGATPAHDPVNNCLWMQGNEVGDALYRITGIDSSTWTTRRFNAVTATRRCINGTYGRFAALQFGAVTLGVRISSTSAPVQVIRLA